MSVVVASEPRLRRMAAPALVGGGLTAATLALHLRDPHESGAWGVCPSLALFGVYCPGCGGLRAVNDLTNLQLADAASSNLLLVALLPFAGILFWRWTTSRWRGVALDPSPYTLRAVTWVMLAVMAVFALVRNLPAGAWLAP